jgi:hypothetical protein
MMNKALINKMLAVMRAKADASWRAMYGTHQYKHIMLVLAKDDESITYVDKEMVGLNLRALCLALGINYYTLLMEVCA